MNLDDKIILTIVIIVTLGAIAPIMAVEVVGSYERDCQLKHGWEEHPFNVFNPERKSCIDTYGITRNDTIM
jgi:hypothetical protein